MRLPFSLSSGALCAALCLTAVSFFAFETEAFRVGGLRSAASARLPPLGLVERASVRLPSANNPTTARSEITAGAASLQQEDDEASTALSALPSGASSPTGSALGGPFPVDLRGKTAFVAGVADDHGYGWAICKLLRAAGARVLVGTWPPVLGIFKKGLDSGKFTQAVEVSLDAEQTVPVEMAIEKVYPLDAAFDVPEDVPPEVAANKRYAGQSEYSISEVAQAVQRDFGGVDILVHSLANGPEVTRPLLQTSRNGYLAAVSSSSYSFVSMLQHFLPIMRPGASALALSYIASERVVPGYGGGMSSAKAALESDCRTLAFEAGRAKNVRVNCISAGPLKSRAASAIGKSGDKSFIDLAIDYSKANAPLQRVRLISLDSSLASKCEQTLRWPLVPASECLQDMESDDVGRAALFLLSPLSRAVTGVTLYVDNGLHAMGQALDSQALQQDSGETATD